MAGPNGGRNAHPHRASLRLKGKTKTMAPRPHGSHSPVAGGTNTGAVIGADASTNARGANATSNQPVRPMRMQTTYATARPVAPPRPRELKCSRSQSETTFFPAHPRLDRHDVTRSGIAGVLLTVDVHGGQVQSGRLAERAAAFSICRGSGNE